MTALTGAAGRAAPVRVGWETVLRVGWLESRRLIRNPVFLAAGLLSGYLILQPWWSGTPQQDYSTQMFGTLPQVAVPMSLVAFVTANFLALRDSDRTTRELLRTSPATAVDRTLGLALAGAIPVLAIAATMLWLRVLIARAGGIPVGDGTPMMLVPSLGMLATLVLAVGAAWTMGIALARTIRSRALAIVVGGLGVFLGQLTFWLWGWFPAYFLMPYASPLTPVDLGQGLTAQQVPDDVPLQYPGSYDGHWYQLILQEDRVLWHGCYLIGVAVLLTAYACWRSGPDRRTWWIALVGLLLAAAGFAGQVIAWGGDVRWFGQAWSL